MAGGHAEPVVPVGDFAVGGGFAHRCGRAPDYGSDFAGQQPEINRVCQLADCRFAFGYSDLAPGCGGDFVRDVVKQAAKRETGSQPGIPCGACGWGTQDQRSAVAVGIAVAAGVVPGGAAVEYGIAARHPPGPSGAAWRPGGGGTWVWADLAG